MARRSVKLISQINVVPYIDVMLVLLVIFMITAPMVPPGVVELPKVGQVLKKNVAPLIITIKLDQSLMINDHPVPQDGLISQLKTALKEDQAIVIAADKNVVYDQVVQVMDLLRRNHFTKVGLLLSQAHG